MPRSLILAAIATAIAVPVIADTEVGVIPWNKAEAARVAKVLTPPTQFDRAEAFEANSGGVGTVPRVDGLDAFSQPALAETLDFRLGEALFEKLWVSSPSSTKASDGLGPLYNARACNRCHIRDGRGHAPNGPEDTATSMVVRLSVPTASELEGWIANRPDPAYGGQIQDHGHAGLQAEAKVQVAYTYSEVTLAGGEVVELRKPTVTLYGLGYGPLSPATQTSTRVAPQMIGLGLLEAIPDTRLGALADPDDADGDGISGRLNFGQDAATGNLTVGRFGWKAGSPTMLDQSSRAFVTDVGISTPLHPDPWGDCTAVQSACQSAPHGDQDIRVFEIDRTGLDLVARYSATLGVPARGPVDAPQVLRGKAMFHQTGCADCHVPKHVTYRLRDDPEHSFQLIWPYTDLLLHDMGPGLADGFDEGFATGREWRTPPLWGVGLTPQVSGVTHYLHDGRARSLLEAILWHGGEAQTAQARFTALPKPDRDALIAFLESL